MANKIQLSRSLSLPTSYVTSTGGVLAVRGAGKTNASRLMAEQMFDAGYPFVAVDPVGSWYGLRAGRNGSKRGGLDVFIFGGKHGDVPLTRESGELVADVVVDQRLACVLDLTEFNTEADKKYFLLKFAMRLFKRNEEPLHLFLEEADDYIPQKPMRDELHLKRAWENIVRRGRSRGLGMTIITQRSAVVNKDVLTQVENLFVLRTTGPQDIKAINEWVKYHSVDDTMLESLSSLDDGEAWIWSPHLLKEFKTFRFNLSRTFDSGATPKGKKGRPVASLRDVDVGKLKGRIQETIEKAAQENPVLLRSQLAKMKAELHSQQVTINRLQQAKPTKVVEVKKLKLPKLKLPDLKQASKAIENLRKVTERVEAMITKLNDAVISNDKQIRTLALAANPPAKGQGVDALFPPHKHKGPITPGAKAAEAHKASKPRTHALETLARASRGTSTMHNASTDAPKMHACPKAMICVLASIYPKTASRPYLALMAKYSLKSSNFSNGLSTLRGAGFIEDAANQRVFATEAGIDWVKENVGEVESLPEGEALLEFWKKKLQACPRAFLQVLYDNYPKAITKEELSEQSAKYSKDGAPYSLTSSNFSNGLSLLRGFELIAGKTEVRLLPQFFGEDPEENAEG